MNQKNNKKYLVVYNGFPIFGIENMKFWIDEKK